MKNAQTKPDPLAARVIQLIDRHAAPVSPGRRESGTPETLVKRLGVPDAKHVAALLQSGRLKSLGPVSRNNPDGPHRFSSDDLNAIKREAFASIAEEVIEGYEGDPAALPFAVNVALTAYAKSLGTTPAAKGAAPLAFAYLPEEEQRPGLLRRAATVAGAAGAAYGGLSYIRGRRTGATGFLPALKAGHVANVATARRAGAAVAGVLTRRPATFAAKTPTLTPARVRSLLLQFGRELRRTS